MPLLASYYTHVWHVTKQIWLPHYKYDSDSLHARWTYRPNILCISTKMQINVTVTSHIIAIYVPETNMPLKYLIYVMYANYFMCRYETTMSVYMPHMNSLHSTIWPGALVYIHFTYMKTPHYCTIHWKSINCNIHLPCYCKIWATYRYALQMPQISHMPKLLNMHLRGKNANIWSYSHQWYS